MTTNPSPRLWQARNGSRAIVALAVGTIAAVALAVIHAQDPERAADFDHIWIAARALVDGQDPYTQVARSGWPWPLLYPLPAVILVVPLAPLPLPLARALFVGLGVGLFAYAVTFQGWGRLVLLLSGGSLWAWLSGQWTHLLTAGALLPLVRPLWAAKPTSALALLALESHRERLWKAILGIIAFTAVSLLIWWRWPVSWIAALRDGAGHVRSPISRPFGWLLLLALIRWRDPRARCLLALALMPQNSLPHEALPLMLLASTRRSILWLTVLSLAGVMLVVMTQPSGVTYEQAVNTAWPTMLTLFYLPALILVLVSREPRQFVMPSTARER